MKRLLILLLCTMLGLSVFAQLTVTLVVSPTPPSNLSEWSQRKDALTYLVNYRPGAIKQVKIKTVIKLVDGTIAGTTNLSTARIITLADGNNIFNAMDVLPLESMIFNGKFKTTIAATGKLPANNYIICVTLVNPIDFAPVSEERCRNFNLASLQLPIGIMPASEATLLTAQAQTAIIFRWTPVSPRPSAPVVYHVEVFQVLPDQKPMQAFRSNLPVLDKAVTGSTQFIWQPQLSMLPFSTADSTATNNRLTFIWTIRATDLSGNPLGDGNINGDGRSEPIIFFVGNEPAAGKTVPKQKQSASFGEKLNAGKSALNDLLLTLNETETLLAADKKSSETDLTASRDQVNRIKNAVATIQTNLNNSAVDEAVTKTNAMNAEIKTLRQLLKKLGKQYTTVSNVLKTKHDTVKNSINNVR